MRTLSLALRNLLRNRRRSLTTLIAMVIGLVTVLIFGAYTRHITYALTTGYVLRSGHLQVQRQGYFLYGTGNPAAYGITRYAPVIDTIVHDPVLAPMVVVATPQLSFNGIAGNFASGVSHTVFGTGAIAADRNRMRQWNEYGMPWRIRKTPLTDSASDTAMVGLGVARILELCEPLRVSGCTPRPRAGAAASAPPAPDDIAALSAQEMPSRASESASDGAVRIELLAATVRGVPNIASLRVVRAEPQGFKEIDDMFIGLHLDQAQRLVYGAEAPGATAVVVLLEHTDQLDAAKARLQQLIDTTLKEEPLEVQDFATLNPLYGQALAMFATIFAFMAVLIGAIVLFTVGNTMSMAVVERTTEIGTLRAMGVRRSGIRRMFVCEALLLGIAAVAIGLATAVAVAWVVNHSGLTWLPPGQVQPAPLAVRLWGEHDLLLGTALVLVLIAVLSAWWPARRAGRMVIIDALRHV